MVDVVLFGISQRCGSTLVQRVINLRDDTLMWGENGRMLVHFDQAYRFARKFCQVGAQDRENYFRKDRDHSVFIANMNPPWEDVEPTLLENFKNIFDRIYDKQRYGVERIGFKEVLHPRPAIQLLKQLYPDVELVFIVRNPIDCWRSVHSWKLHKVENWSANWCKNLSEIIDLEDESLFIWYEDLIVNRVGVDKLAEFAGVEEADVLELMDAGRVGATPDRDKNTARSEDIDQILRIIDEKLDGELRDRVHHYLKIAGHGG